MLPVLSLSFKSFQRGTGSFCRSKGYKVVVYHFLRLIRGLEHRPHASGAQWAEWQNLFQISNFDSLQLYSPMTYRERLAVNVQNLPEQISNTSQKFKNSKWLDSSLEGQNRPRWKKNEKYQVFTILYPLELVLGLEYHQISNSNRNIFNTY